MKRIVSLFMTVLMTFTLMSVNVIAHDDTNVEVCNDMVVYTAMRTCPNCHKKTLEVTCAGSTGEPNYEDTPCISYGHPSGCMITKRLKYYSHGVCYGCNTIVQRYDTHVESCVHTKISSTPIVTCVYK